jgi:hypothetical protein
VVGKQALAVKAAQLLQRPVLDLADALTADLQLLAEGDPTVPASDRCHPTLVADDRLPRGHAAPAGTAKR